VVHLAEQNRSEARCEFERYRQQLRSEPGIDPTPRLYALVRERFAVTAW